MFENFTELSLTLNVIPDRHLNSFIIKNTWNVNTPYLTGDMFVVSNGCIKGTGYQS